MTDALAMFADLLRPAVVYSIGYAIDADGVRKKAADPTETNVNAVLPQPLKAEEMQLLPEGARVSNYLKTWSRTQINPGHEIEWPSEGVRFVVFQQDPWGSYGNFFRYVIRQIESDEEFNRLEPGPV